MHASPARLSTLALAMSCLLLCQCSHQQPIAPHRKMQWQVVGHDPLTYAPMGFKPPGTEISQTSVPEYVYLADRSTRFYIPPLATEYREAALAARADSLKLGPEIMPPRDIPKPERVKKSFSAKETARLVYRVPATALIGCLVILSPYGPLDVSDALDGIWSS